MKKMAGVLLAATVLAGCAHSAGALAPDALQHQRFVLSTFDGQPLPAGQPHQPEIRFDEKMHVSGVMCNRFMGEGKLVGNTLTVPGMASTRMLCADARLNQLDQVIGQMLTQGATVTLAHQTLTLRNSQHVLVWQRAESAENQ